MKYRRMQARIPYDLFLRIRESGYLSQFDELVTELLEDFVEGLEDDRRHKY